MRISSYLMFPKQRLRGGVLTLYVHKLAGSAGFSVAGVWFLAVAGGFGGRCPWLWLADSVAGGRGCGWELRAPVAGCGCGWGALVQMWCVWLGLEFIMYIANKKAPLASLAPQQLTFYC